VTLECDRTETRSTTALRIVLLPERQAYAVWAFDSRLAGQPGNAREAPLAANRSRRVALGPLVPTDTPREPALRSQEIPAVELLARSAESAPCRRPCRSVGCYPVVSLVASEVRHHTLLFPVRLFSVPLAVPGRLCGRTCWDSAPADPAASPAPDRPTDRTDIRR